MSAYDLLHQKMQKAIYKMGWASFRPIQEEAINYLSNISNKEKEKNLIISAPTASGKTEACFLPIISNIINHNYKGVKILYISPLKALINDQFIRIEKLCEELKFPIVKWHGDANQTEKKKIIKEPDGILLITPESIESLFINRYFQIEKLFFNLEYIVIDEIHTLVEEPRGNHLFSLIHRIENIIGRKVSKIALSATINDYETVQKWIDFKNPDSVKVITSRNHIADNLVGCINGFNIEEYNAKLLNKLFDEIKVGKNLVFENSKNGLEVCCVRIKDIAKKEKILNRFYIHHGSLSKEIRETTEQRLKKEKDITVFCTSTLELGIDIGDIDKVILLSPPYSVSSTIQRIGRSGRKNNSKKNFRMYVEEIPLYDDLQRRMKLRLDTFRGIAIIELMVREGWCEPFELQFDYSTILHQILSLLGGTGGKNINDIYNIVIKDAFRNTITKKTFIQLIKSLKDSDVIYQMTNGLITLSKNGENIVHNFNFYPAFSSEDSFEVEHKGTIIGFLNIDNITLNTGDDIVIGGKQWNILTIEYDLKKILVKKSNGGKPIFVSEGMVKIHKKIQEKMKNIYEGIIDNFPYVDDKVKQFIIEGRKEYNEIKDKCLWTFVGSKVQNTLNFIFTNCLNGFELDLLEDLRVGFYHPQGKNFLTFVLKKIKFSENTIKEILSKLEVKDIQKTNKFDYLLSKDLLIDEYIALNFDVEGTIDFIKSL